MGRVVFALLPKGSGLASISSVDGISPGLVTAGLGRVPAPQTYLDISQGNRVSESLYEPDLPFVRFTATGVAPVDWDVIADRAADAPADVVPGLLASMLEHAGLEAGAEGGAGLGRLIAADRDGRVDRTDGDDCPGAGCPALRVVKLEPTKLERLVAGLREDDLLIALQRPPPTYRTLALGVAGDGFDGGLVTSETTRTEGLVTTTDLAPTILGHLGVAVPGEMNGRQITAGGERDIEGLLELDARLEVTRARRGTVVGQTLLAWVILTAVAVAVWRRRVAPVAVQLLALSVVYLPLVLLLTPILDPSLLAERLAVGLGAPLLALVTWRLLGGWRALAAACLLVVGAYAADVVAGSILVPVSIPGPNPASGVRFYGIGNEIEATVAALVPIGVGALLASFARTREGGALAAGVFLAVGLVAAAAFALGRFGADVGAAIVLPAGAAVAAAVALPSRRGIVLAFVVPLAALAALMAADLLLGGEAHLTRSVLDAGGLDEAADSFERRIRLAALSFTKGPNVPFYVPALLVIAVGVWKRREIPSWFGDRAALAGFAGALAAAVLGTVSNDSGVTLLILGTAFCLCAAGYAWGRSRAAGTLR